MSEATIEYRSIAPTEAEWRFADDAASGSFAGYLSIFGATDTYGTRMLPGCWNAGGLQDGEIFPFLDMHAATSVRAILGGFSAKEDDRGLFIEGRFASTQAGQEARTLAGMGLAPELSVGFVRLRSQPTDPDALTACRLVEGSSVIKGMASTPGASLVAVRTDPKFAREVEQEVRRVLEEIRTADVLAKSVQRRKAALRVRLLAS